MLILFWAIIFPFLLFISICLIGAWITSPTPEEAEAERKREEKPYPEYLGIKKKGDAEVYFKVPCNTRPQNDDWNPGRYL